MLNCQIQECSFAAIAKACGLKLQIMKHSTFGRLTFPQRSALSKLQVVPNKSDEFAFGQMLIGQSEMRQAKNFHL